MSTVSFMSPKKALTFLGLLSSLSLRALRDCDLRLAGGAAFFCDDSSSLMSNTSSSS